MRIKKLLLSLSLICLAFLLTAQEKHAVLIVGDFDYRYWKEEYEWPGGIGKALGPDEFWFDLYLMWESLINKGYDNNNIYVLFDNGDDFSSVELIANEYNPRVEYIDIIGIDGHITDNSATKTNVESVFNSLAGTMNSKDFLLVWTFGHGAPDDYGNNLLALYDGEIIADYELAALTNQINCYKKVFLMQQCTSGGFVDDLEANNTIIFTSTNDAMVARATDGFFYDDIDYPGDSVPGNEWNAVESEVYSDYEYDHGEFNYHLFNALNQKTPDEKTYYEKSNGNIPLSNADLDGDGITNFYEASEWVKEYDSWQKYGFYSFDGQLEENWDDPQWSDQGGIGTTTSLLFPTILNSNITNDKTCFGDVGLGTNIRVQNNSDLEFESNSKLYLRNNANLTVESGSTLKLYDGIDIISDNPDCSIDLYGNLILDDNVNLEANIVIKSGATLNLTANETLNLTGNGKITIEYGGTLVINNNYIINGAGSTNTITINGNLQVGAGVKFSSSTSNSFGGLVLNNDNLVLNLNNCEFSKANLTGNCQTLNITNTSTFSNSVFQFTEGNLTIESSQFINTQIRATNALSSSQVQITDCEMEDSDSDAVYINAYNSFSIENCNIHDNAFNGIYLDYAGSTSGLISENIIENNGLDTLSNYAGIRLYNSDANIYDNSIMNNRYGIMCLNASVTSILGDSTATNKTELQQIRENEINQIYASSTSFPYDIHYNYIELMVYDDPFIYYDGTAPAGSLNVDYNYWGRRTITSDILYPFDSYVYLPRIMYIIPRTVTSDETLYKQAKTSKETGEYATATTQFEQVVELYPESMYTEPSLIELLAVEEMGAQNYNKLKQYYLNDKTIGKHKNLEKLAGKLANYCNLKQKKYPEAIDWFEKEIENPETLEDYVFAIIDLGNTYLLMEDEKSSYTGKLAEYKFESVAKYEIKREELIDLLFDHKKELPFFENQKNSKEETDNETIFKLKQEFNINVFPNPFRQETQIQYTIKEPSQVSIRIFDNIGKEVTVLSNESQDQGNYQKTLNATNLSPGIYYYSVYINGKHIITEKLLHVE